MPRRDGQPTNAEMMVDLNTAAHTIFTDAFETQLQGTLPDAYQDKPLNSISLAFTENTLDLSRLGIPAPSEAGPLTYQKFETRAMTPSDADMFTLDNLQTRNFSEEALELYRAQAKAVANVALTNSVMIRDVFPIQAAQFSYYAESTEGYRTPSVHTLSEKPVKSALALAGAFVNQVETYEQSNEFAARNQFREGLHVTEQLPSFDEFVHIVRSGKSLDHKFELDIRSDVPLNGYESKEYLTAYAQEMGRMLQNQSARLERIESLGAPTMFTDVTKENIATYKTAYQNAVQLLEDK